MIKKAIFSSKLKQIFCDSGGVSPLGLLCGEGDKSHPLYPPALKNPLPPPSDPPMYSCKGNFFQTKDNNDLGFMVKF